MLVLDLFILALDLFILALDVLISALDMLILAASGGGLAPEMVENDSLEASWDHFAGWRLRCSKTSVGGQ